MTAVQLPYVHGSMDPWLLVYAYFCSIPILVGDTYIWMCLAVWPDWKGIEAQLGHTFEKGYQRCRDSCPGCKLFLSWQFRHHAVQRIVKSIWLHAWRPWCVGQDPVPHWQLDTDIIYIYIYINIYTYIFTIHQSSCLFALFAHFCIDCVLHALRYELHPQALLVRFQMHDRNQCWTSRMTQGSMHQTQHAV